MTWQEDREKLREALRLGMQNKTLRGLEATFLCVLVSHMRGKIHMGSYAAKKGGWRPWQIRTARETKAPEVYVKRYGDWAQKYFEDSVIETLADQEAWIRKFIYEVDFEVGALQLLAKLVERVLTKNWNEGATDDAAEVLHSADPQREGQRLRGLFSRLSGLYSRRKNAGGS